jgi:branched-chain amino acid transport system ATP-binding protein
MLLEVHNVTVRFRGLYALYDISLSVSEGEVVGIIGPNGAGKTTFFNLLTGFVSPSAGRLFFNGIDILGKKPHQINHFGIARTFQNIRLFGDLTVKENVKLGHQNTYNISYTKMLGITLARTPSLLRIESDSDANARKVLQICRLEEKQDELAKNLPYGDQRLLEMARALACNPKMILLDEPTAGMDPEETQAMMCMIRELQKQFGITIMLIEHDMKVIMNISDRVIAIDYGKLIADDIPEKVQNNQQVIEAYLGGLEKLC